MIRNCDNQGGECVEFDDDTEGAYFEQHSWADVDGVRERLVECMWLCPRCMESEDMFELQCWPWNTKV